MTDHDSYSVEQAERFGWSSLGALNEERVSFLSGNLPTGSVLDLGCGPGGWSLWMASQGRWVVSLDAQRIYLQDREVPRRVQASAERLPLADRSVDSVVCMDVLEHLDDDLGALREMVRVARKRVLLTVPREDPILDGFNLTFLHWQDRTHRRAYTEAAVRSLLERAGCHRYRIVPELSVPWRPMLRALVRPRNTLPNRLRHLLVGISDLLARPGASQGRRQRIEARVMRGLLAPLAMPELPTGLAVVVELEE